MPPYGPHGPSSAEQAVLAAKSLNITVRMLLCTHADMDHFRQWTLREMCRHFPTAAVCLPRGFDEHIRRAERVRWFDELPELSLGGDHSFSFTPPKHRVTDTVVVFRGTVCPGDWELRTIRSVHDFRSGITAQPNASPNEFQSAKNQRTPRILTSKPSEKPKTGKPIQREAADYDTVVSGVIELLDAARRASARARFFHGDDFAGSSDSERALAE